jgi:hypothetical protein
MPSDVVPIRPGLSPAATVAEVELPVARLRAVALREALDKAAIDVGLALGLLPDIPVCTSSRLRLQMAKATLTDALNEDNRALVAPRGQP